MSGNGQLSQIMLEYWSHCKRSVISYENEIVVPLKHLISVHVITGRKCGIYIAFMIIRSVDSNYAAVILPQL